MPSNRSTPERIVIRRVTSPDAALYTAELESPAWSRPYLLIGYAASAMEVEVAVAAYVALHPGTTVQDERS